MPRYAPLKPKVFKPLKELPYVGLASLKQASELLGFNERTLRNKSREGKWPGRLIEGRWKFPWEWVRTMAGAK